MAKAQRKQTHKATTTTKNGRHKLTENHEKLTPGGVPEALGGGLWTISVSGVPQRGPRDARSRKSDEKFVHSSLLPCFLGTPKSYIFGMFRFRVVFWGMFFGSGFWRPPGTIFKGFGGGFRGVFSCFFEHVGQGSVLRKTSFCIVFYNVSGTSTFTKQVKN